MAIQEVGSARSRVKGLVRHVRRLLTRLRIADWRARQARIAREQQAFDDRQAMTKAGIFQPPRGGW